MIGEPFLNPDSPRNSPVGSGNTQSPLFRLRHFQVSLYHRKPAGERRSFSLLVLHRKVRRRYQCSYIDSHLDIAYNALVWDRDLLQSIRHIRESEAGMPEKGRGLNIVNFEELRRGNIGLFFVTVTSRIASLGKRFAGVRNQDIAHAKCMGQLAYYRLMQDRGVLRQIQDLEGAGPASV